VATRITILRARVRLALLLIGLLLLLGSASGYVWVQRPLRDSAAAERQLTKNVGRIMTLDEILTMSARMSAAAKDPAYETRYNEHVDELDKLIQSTISTSTDADVIAAVKTTDQANVRLVAMETKSFELDKEGRHAEALALLESPGYRTDKATYALGMRLAFERLEHVTAQATARVERKASAIRVAALVSLAILLLAAWFEYRERRRQKDAEELENMVERRTQQLAHRNRSMRMVLDNVQQGLLALDADGKVTSERSVITEKWLGSSPLHMDFADYVKAHDAKFAATFALAMETLREDFLPMEVAFDQMPRRLRLGERGERIVDVTYQPIFATEEEAEGETAQPKEQPTSTARKLEGILVVMTDVTVELEREIAEAEQRELLAAFEHVRRDRVGYASFVKEAGILVDRLTATGDATPSLESSGVLIHTLKGTAAQFGMLRLAGLCHSIEDRLAEQRALLPEDQEALREGWRTGTLRIRPLLGDGGMTIERREFENVVDLLRLRRRHEVILDVVQAWELDPVQARLDRLGEYASSLATRLGKPNVDVVCEANGLRLDHAGWATFWAACVHVVRNAIDHGIEPAHARLTAGKKAYGRLSISARTDGESFVVCFNDDGGGVAWDRLAARARERGMPFESPSDRLEVLLADGISSKNDVSDISGRGIGMFAVRAETERRGGVVSVTSTPGTGTTVAMRFPIKSMMTVTATAATTTTTTVARSA
jgi:HPt (histidine-containing phosphotransfer) domain-containing protein